MVSVHHEGCHHILHASFTLLLLTVCSTLDFPGKDESDLPLAECGCVIPDRKNGLSDNSLVRCGMPLGGLLLVRQLL